jgi:hypothetical protein
MRAYGDVDLQLHSFLTSAVYVWVVLKPDGFPLRKDTSVLTEELLKATCLKPTEYR